MGILNIVALLPSAFITVAAAVIVAEVLLAMRAAKRQTKRPDPPAGPVAVLVPAHDEARNILPVLQAIRRQMASGDRLVVIADNCSDTTARIALEQHCEVVERHDPEHFGKGYALEFGLAHLSKSDWIGAIVVVDADCIPGDHSIALLAAAVVANGRPAQGKYLMRSPSASQNYALAELAWTIKNHVRPLGLASIGMPSPLFGSGMAFTRPQLEGISLASSALAEDTRLYVELTLRGRPPLYVQQAEFFSTFPASDLGAQSQRRRWEHGHLLASVHGVPRLIRRAVTDGDGRALVAALDLMVPPLSLLVLLSVAVGGMNMALLVWPGMRAPVVLLASGATMLAASLALAWNAFGRHIVSGIGLTTALPGYVAGKIGLYLTFIKSPQRTWVRTHRGNEKNGTH